MNKFIVAVSVLVAAVATVVFFYFKNLNSSVSQSQPLKAIPETAALVVDLQHSNDFFVLVKKSKLLEDLFTPTQLAKLNDLNKSFLQHADLYKTLENQRILISSHIGLNDNVEMLFVIPVKDELLDSFFEHLSDEENRAKYNASEIFGVNVFATQTINKESFFFCHYKGLFIGSFDKKLIEQSLDLQVNSQGNALGSLIKVESNKAKAVQASVYINYEQLSIWVDAFLEKNRKGEFRFLSQIAQSSNLNLNYKSDALMFNGITEAGLSTSNYLAMFLNQKPQTIKIPLIISENTAVLVDFGIENYAQFKKDQKVYLGQNKQISTYEKWISNFNKVYRADFENDWAAFMGNEFALVMYNNEGINVADSQMAVVALSDTAKAAAYLGGLIVNSRGRSQSLNYRGFAIYYCDHPDILSNALGSVYKEIRRPYMAIVNDYLIAATSESLLQKFIDEYLQLKPLEDNERYRSFAKYINSQSNVYVYLNVANSRNMLTKGVKNEFSEFLNSNKGVSNYYGLTFQLNSSGGQFFSNMTLLYLPQTEKTVKDSTKYTAATTISLEGDLAKQPILVKSEAGDNAFVLLDKRNQVYFVNESGKLFWKFKLDNPVLGNIQVIQPNGKPILIFNTYSKLYVCDENAMPLSGFPIVFRKKITAPVSVFDYDGNHDYRFFVPLSDRSVFAFDLKGKAVAGWNPKRNVGSFDKSFQMVKMAGITFLFTVSTDNKFSFFDRKGKLLSSGKLPNSVRNEFYPVINTKASNSKFVSSDASGNIVTIFFDGRVRSKTMGSWSGEQFFALKNIAGNEQPEYVFFDKNHLFVYATDGSLIYDYEPEGKASTEVQFFKSPDGKCTIGLNQPEAHQLIELKEKGELSSGFPVEGSTAFAKYNSKLYGDFSVIVGADNHKVIIFKKQ
ncbi:hypothetical protein NF867_05565 [Solitalea sp. MAHUQ-68]|uniref:Uncharacterized protein n=1 Tax=Solitalea agri TaxID=2953739 RepID=A0A9X2JBT6_9SPHI|nr:hypothetical protein [Solitalea agri]MCO4292328.1 hypothetical protein [Solitalea agri]